LDSQYTSDVGEQVTVLSFASLMAAARRLMTRLPRGVAAYAQSGLGQLPSSGPSAIRRSIDHEGSLVISRRAAAISDANDRTRHLFATSDVYCESK